MRTVRGGSRASGVLTPREREVLTKLGLRSRAEAAPYAVRHPDVAAH